MKLLIRQSFGLGDILFLTPLVYEIYQEFVPDEIVWPITDQYYWIKDYLDLPVTFIKTSEQDKLLTGYYDEIDFEHAHDRRGKVDRDCMEAKYNLIWEGELEVWRTLGRYIKRNYEKEQELLDILNIKPEDEDQYIFVNNHFAAPEHNYRTNIKIETDLRIVEMRYVEGFTLLDWCGVLEGAAEIHTVSTALLFVVEAIKPGNEWHLYPRIPLDTDLSPIISLIENSNWKIHEQ